LLPGHVGLTPSGGNTRGAVATSSASNHASELTSRDEPSGAGTTMPTTPGAPSSRRLVHTVVRVPPTATATLCSTGFIDALESHVLPPSAFALDAKRSAGIAVSSAARRMTKHASATAVPVRRRRLRGLSAVKSIAHVLGENQGSCCRFFATEQLRFKPWRA